MRVVVRLLAVLHIAERRQACLDPDRIEGFLEREHRIGLALGFHGLAQVLQRLPVHAVRLVGSGFAQLRLQGGKPLVVSCMDAALVRATLIPGLQPRELGLP